MVEGCSIRKSSYRLDSKGGRGGIRLALCSVFARATNCMLRQAVRSTCLSYPASPTSMSGSRPSSAFWKAALFLHPGTSLRLRNETASCWNSYCFWSVLLSGLRWSSLRAGLTRENAGAYLITSLLKSVWISALLSTEMWTWEANKDTCVHTEFMNAC